MSVASRQLASELWSRLPLAGTWSREPELLSMVRGEVMHPAEPLQRAAAHALAHLVARDSQDPAAVLDALQETYLSKLPVGGRYSVRPAEARRRRGA